MATTPAGRKPASLVLRWREPATRIVSRLIPGDVIWYVDTPDPVFALTFDDGPTPGSTPRLLDVLARHHAKATFFLVGERVEALRRERADLGIGPDAVRRARVVAEVDRRFGRRTAKDLAQDRQASDARIEHADRARIGHLSAARRRRPPPAHR